MNWLITTKTDVDLEQLLAKLAVFGCEMMDDAAPIPLGENEQVFEITGPDDLTEKITGDDSILDIYPNSELTLFGD